MNMSASIDFEAFIEEAVQRSVSGDIYMLLDHAGLDGLRQQLARSPLEWKSLFEGTKEANAMAVAPIVVSVVRNGTISVPRSFCKWLGERGTYSSSILILSSPLDLGSLANRLIKRLNVELSENMAALLRFFDPRVFEALMNTLTIEQRELFLCPADQWWYVDRTGIPRNVESVFGENEESSYRLALSADQEFALVDACEIDQVLTLLRERVPSLIESKEYKEFFRSVELNMENAKRIGLSSIEDLALYNIVVLSSDEVFLGSPMWLDILAETERSPDKFSGLLLALDSDCF